MGSDRSPAEAGAKFLDASRRLQGSAAAYGRAENEARAAIQEAVSRGAIGGIGQAVRRILAACRP